MWTMISGVFSGMDVLVGDFRLPVEAKVRFTDPWGNAQHTVSGSKVEHGRGGFEFRLSPQVRGRTCTLTVIAQEESHSYDISIPEDGAGVRAVFEDQGSDHPRHWPDAKAPTHPWHWKQLYEKLDALEDKMDRLLVKAQ